MKIPSYQHTMERNCFDPLLTVSVDKLFRSMANIPLKRTEFLHFCRCIYSFQKQQIYGKLTILHCYILIVNAHFCDLKIKSMFSRCISSFISRDTDVTGYPEQDDDLLLVFINFPIFFQKKHQY